MDALEGPGENGAGEEEVEDMLGGIEAIAGEGATMAGAGTTFGIPPKGWKSKLSKSASLKD